MPLIQWIMQNLEMGTYVTGVTAGGSANVVKVYHHIPLGDILAGGEAVITVTNVEVTSMIDFLGGLAESQISFKYPTDFSF